MLFPLVNVLATTSALIARASVHTAPCPMEHAPAHHAIPALSVISNVTSTETVLPVFATVSPRTKALCVRLQRAQEHHWTALAMVLATLSPTFAAAILAGSTLTVAPYLVQPTVTVVAIATASIMPPHSV